MKLVIIEWVDVAGDSGSWETMKELLKGKPLGCRSVGWVIKETDEYIHVVPNIAADPEDEDEGFGGASIPKDYIKSIQEVEDYEKDECD